MTFSELTHADLARIAALNAEVPGWSGPSHYAFFRALLNELFLHVDAPRILMLGIYHGRDLAYLLDLLQREHPGRSATLIGVDKFDNEPCADWPEAKRGLSWESAGFGEPPALKRAEAHLLSRVGTAILRLYQSDDAAFLEGALMAPPALRMKFDAIYVDTSHDYATVARQLRQLAQLCCDDATLICGDDYSDAGTWGVARAVREAFSDHRVFANWIWFAPRSALAAALRPAA